MNDHKKIDLYDLRSSLTEEECLVQDSVARFVDQDILPIIGEHFAAHTIPADLAPKMGKLGLLGANLEGYGCAGLSQTAYGLICQELERGDSTLRSLLSVQSSLVMWCIHQFGSEAHKERWLPAMVTGESLGCFGLTEPQGGSDPANMKTNAKRDGDNWILNGSKMWITNGTLAAVAVVLALGGLMVDSGSMGLGTLTTFILYSQRLFEPSILRNCFFLISPCRMKIDCQEQKD